MKFVSFLTSRGVAVFLLTVSVGLLILWNRYPALYSPLFLIIPVFLFLSISFCIVNRIASSHARHSARFWCSIIFHIGMLIIIASTSLGHLARFFAVIALPHGISVNLDDKGFSSIYEEPPLQKEAPFMNFKLTDFQIKYQDGRFPIEYISHISIGVLGDDGYHNIKGTVAINNPLNYEGYSFLLQSGGYSPRFILKDKDGRVFFDGYINLSNNTKTEDVFYVKEADLTIYTRFFPDMYKEGNRVGSLSLVPRNPAFGIRMFKRDDPFRDVWKGVLKKGERAGFEGMSFEFADLKPYVIIQVVKDPAYWGILAGWLLIVGGLLLRYLPLKKLNKERVQVSNGRCEI